MVEAELKHCRVAMLAVVGWLVQVSSSSVVFSSIGIKYWSLLQERGIHLPSPDGLYDVANPIDAFFHVGWSPISQIFIFIGALESINHKGKLGQWEQDPAREPGRYELPIYGASQLKGKTKQQVDDLKLKEVRNGRLAMLGEYGNDVSLAVCLSQQHFY
jgi:hypothetical protein